MLNDLTKNSISCFELFDLFWLRSHLIAGRMVIGLTAGFTWTQQIFVLFWQPHVCEEIFRCMSAVSNSTLAAAPLALTLRLICRNFDSLLITLSSAKDSLVGESLLVAFRSLVECMHAGSFLLHFDVPQSDKWWDENMSKHFLSSVHHQKKVDSFFCHFQWTFFLLHNKIISILSIFVFSKMSMLEGASMINRVGVATWLRTKLSHNCAAMVVLAA